MALPAPGTFSSLSAETPCYTFNYAAGPFAPSTNVPYTDCNGLSASITASASQTGTFCARSASSVGQVNVDNVGTCPCKTWNNYLFNSAEGRNYTFSWIDCNGQPVIKNIVIENIPGNYSFFSCSKSKPVVIVSGGPYDLTQTLEYQYCNRGLVG
jgi:hypothetical protein